MQSSDFYLAPMTMSYFYLEALEEQGYAFPKGWRSRQQRIEAELEDGKIVLINTVDGRIEIEEIVGAEAKPAR